MRNKKNKMTTIEEHNLHSLIFEIQTTKIEFKTNKNLRKSKIGFFSCQMCGCEFSKRWESFFKNPGCPVCSTGFLGEKICRLIFETVFHKPFYKTRSLNWLVSKNGNRMELDGYNEDLRIAFEHQGHQHYKEISGSVFRKHISLKEQKSLDNRKRNLCKENGVLLFEIKDFVNGSKSIFLDVQEHGPIIPIPKFFVSLFAKKGIDIHNDFLIDLRKVSNHSSQEEIKVLQTILSKTRMTIEQEAVYLSSTIKIPVVCDVCGKKWAIAPSKIKAGVGCRRCKNNEKIDYSAYVDIATERNHKITTKPCDFINKRTKLELLCNVCDQKWIQTASVYRKSKLKCKNRKCKSNNPNSDGKIKVMRFFEDFKRLPRPTGKELDESKMYGLMKSYCSKSASQYDEDFEKWAVSRGHRSAFISWTKENCAIVAKDYANRRAFQEGHRKAYQAAHRNGWLDDVCSHMIGKYRNLDLKSVKKLQDPALIGKN